MIFTNFYQIITEITNIFCNVMYSAIDGIYGNVYGELCNGIVQLDIGKMINLDSMIVAFNVGKQMFFNDLINQREHIVNTNINKTNINKTNINKTNIDKTNINKTNILQRYNTIYTLNWINRVLIYCSLSYFSSIFNSKYILNVLLILFVIPKIQNKIINSIVIKDINVKICYELELVFKYIMSKRIINYIRKHGIKISNYNIFLLINVLNTTWFFNFLQNFIFVNLMMLLRKYESTYYYYKGIKLSYYYKTGYSINKIQKNEAIQQLKQFIQEKTWEDINSVEFVTLLYNIFLDEYPCIVNLKYNIIKIFTTWSLCEWFIVKIHLNHYLVIFGFIYIGFKGNNILNEYDSYRNIMILSTIWHNNKIIYTITSLCITIIIIFKEYIHTLLDDILFYTKHYSSIKKLIKYNQEIQIK